MKARKVILIGVVTGLAIAMLGCKMDSSNVTSDSRSKAQAQQEQIANRAQSVVPAYKPEKFSVRKAVNEWSRQADLSSEWYIYVTNMQGEYTGYYVASSPPVNYCMLMTPPDRIRKVEVDLGGAWGDAVVTESAPNLDGVYSGGGGASCSLWFWIDAETGGVVGTVASTLNLEFTNVMFNIDVPRRGQPAKSEK